MRVFCGERRVEGRCPARRCAAHQYSHVVMPRGDGLLLSDVGTRANRERRHRARRPGYLVGSHHALPFRRIPYSFGVVGGLRARGSVPAGQIVVLQTRGMVVCRHVYSGALLAPSGCLRGSERYHGVWCRSRACEESLAPVSRLRAKPISSVCDRPCDDQR